METRYLLGEQQIPTHWYNIIPDMPGPLAPVIHPRTLQPVTPQDMLPLFPPALLEQEMSSDRRGIACEGGARGARHPVQSLRSRPRRHGRLRRLLRRQGGG